MSDFGRFPSGVSSPQPTGVTLKLLKALAILIVVASAMGALGLWYQTFLVGAYYKSSGIFLAILGGAVPFIVPTGAFYVIRGIVNLDPADLA